eukprot:6208409-Pleurochrysis_carterae.AAC.4
MRGAWPQQTRAHPQAVVGARSQHEVADNCSNPSICGRCLNLARSKGDCDCRNAHGSRHTFARLG